MVKADARSGNALNQRPRLLFVVAEDWYFWTHRLPLAVAAREAGFDVAVATRVRDYGERIRDAGLRLFPIPLSRGGLHPLRESRALYQIFCCYRKFLPQIVHLVGLKPTLIGSFAARLAGIPRIIVALGGLGYVFISHGLRARILRPFVVAGYRAALRRAETYLILQNSDDLRLLVAAGIADTGRTCLIRGSGVDLDAFPAMPLPDGVPLVVMPARLLRHKGVREFVEAAASLKQRGIKARFALVGAPDPENPSSIPESWIQEQATTGVIEWWGWRDGMADVFRQCHIVCLPSYREGLPKALLEGAACGRALITTDVPGCREAVAHGLNGLLVPPRDALALADALDRLIRDRDLQQQMGEASRRRAVEQFSVETVIDKTLALYRLGTQPTPHGVGISQDCL